MRVFAAHAVRILLLPVFLLVLAYWLADDWLAGRETGSMK
jgi:hypothetical protein